MKDVWSFWLLLGTDWRGRAKIVWVFYEWCTITHFQVFTIEFTSMFITFFIIKHPNRSYIQNLCSSKLLIHTVVSTKSPTDFLKMEKYWTNIYFNFASPFAVYAGNYVIEEFWLSYIFNHRRVFVDSLNVHEKKCSNNLYLLGILWKTLPK